MNSQSNLLIMEGFTNKNFFEFYIQPQKVAKGSTIPSLYHVISGNLNYPEIIPKLTFDLCHIYSNFGGGIREPNVLRCAKKLSKIIIEYNLNLNNNFFSLGQTYIIPLNIKK